MNNWPTKLGGAFSALGTALMGFGIIPNKTSDNIDELKWLSITGFVCLGLGQFFGNLFSASTGQMKHLTERVDNNTKAITSGDSSMVSPIKEK